MLVKTHAELLSKSIWYNEHEQFVFLRIWIGCVWSRRWDERRQHLNIGACRRCSLTWGETWQHLTWSDVFYVSHWRCCKNTFIIIVVWTCFAIRNAHIHIYRDIARARAAFARPTHLGSHMALATPVASQRSVPRVPFGLQRTQRGEKRRCIWLSECFRRCMGHISGRRALFPEQTF